MLSVPLLVIEYSQALSQTFREALSFPEGNCPYLRVKTGADSHHRQRLGQSRLQTSHCLAQTIP